MSNSKLKKIIIFGSSETAALAKYYFENDSKYKVIAFTVDDDFVEIEELLIGGVNDDWQIEEHPDSIFPSSQE